MSEQRSFDWPAWFLIVSTNVVGWGTAFMFLPAGYVVAFALGLMFGSRIQQHITADMRREERGR